MFEWTSSLEHTAGIVLYDRVFEFPCGDVRVQSDCREIFLEVAEASRYWETALRLPERHDFTFTLRSRQPEESERKTRMDAPNFRGAIGEVNG